MPNVVIGGCRDYNNYSFFCMQLDLILSSIIVTPITIISGHCSGVDSMAEKYAREKGYKILTFPAQWAKYGAAAGPIRNRRMVEISDYVIAFWDYKSKGTASLIRYADKLCKKTFIIDITKTPLSS